MTAPVGDDLTWLDDLERAHAAATPGPWAQHPADPTYVIGDISDGGESYLDVANAAAGGLSDAEAIVALHNAVPTLIADARELRALREAVEGLAGLVKQGRAWTGDSLARRLRATLAAAKTPESVTT